MSVNVRRVAAVLGALTVVALAVAGIRAVVPAPAPSVVAVPVVAAPRIHDVQGATRLSPLAGQQVTEVPGIVTAVRRLGPARGFWFQDPAPDADPATSEGLFAFTGDQTPAVSVGDAVLVSGTVAEFYPTGDEETPESTPYQSITELTGVRVGVASSGNPLPDAELLDQGTVPDGYAPDAGGGSIEALPLEPARFALDFLESREGMRVRVDDARVVGRTDDADGLWVTTKPGQNPTPRGGTIYASYPDPNSGRLKIDSLISPGERPFPVADVGDRLAGTTEGPLHYTETGGYVLLATALGERVAGGIVRETAAPAAAGQIGIGTYNVENLSAGDEQAEVDRLAAGVVTGMGAPEVVALEEVQDDSGPVDDGTVSATGTLGRLTDAIVAAGGPRYQWRQIDPGDLADGGQPGGNIRVVLLHDPARVSVVDRPGGDATTAVAAVPGPVGATLSVSPGRVAPADPAWEDSRKPLAAEYSVQGRPLIVIADHFTSKGGDQPLHGRFQPPDRSSEPQRTRQAAVVRGFVDELLRADPAARVVVLGDLNDFPFSPTLRALTDGGALTSLIDTLPPAERYGYVFEGNSQALDHILVTPSISAPGYDIVHVNAEFADQASDHDPQVLRFVPDAGSGVGLQ